MAMLISRNPATGEIIKELAETPLEQLPLLFTQARDAQHHWKNIPSRIRSRYLLNLRETILNQVDDLIDLISKENGKPPFEALANEILPSLDTLTFFATKGPNFLKEKTIPLRLMKHRKSSIQYWPLGVVAVISPWNYPFLLPFADIIMALIAGNSVIFKPSEVTPCIGLKIQELCNEAGLPLHLVQTVIGGGNLGAALIEQKPNKIFFTGSVSTGKKVMKSASEHLIPINLELGGKDAMIILPDADLDFASSAALWGSFSNSGQVCASTERILVHEKIYNPFIEKLNEKVKQLRPKFMEPAQYELGPVTYERQKAIYDQHLEEARNAGAQILIGGEFSPDRRYLSPTVVSGKDIEKLKIYNEETFGPVVAVSQFQSTTEAIKKANQSPYGLNASIITKNHSMAEEIAKQLEVGTVMINEVLYTAGLGETPWGGVKESGMGRTHSEVGLYEFVNIRHIHKPISRLSVHKSLWWFPYTPFQFQTFRIFLELYRRSRMAKLKAIPLLLWNLVKTIKEEKRI